MQARLVHTLIFDAAKTGCAQTASSLREALRPMSPESPSDVYGTGCHRIRQGLSATCNTRHAAHAQGVGIPGAARRGRGRQSCGARQTAFLLNVLLISYRAHEHISKKSGRKTRCY
eukprot:360802-Chlamydomonas_euryale.AAC.1